MYVVGWRLVERCQLSCVSCLGGVGDNVMFTLRLTRLLMLRSALLQVTSNERECGIQAAPRDGYIGQTMVVQNADTLVQMMSIDIWLKSCNACETREVHSYKKKLKKQSSLSQEFRESKKRDQSTTYWETTDKMNSPRLEKQAAFCEPLTM